MKHQSILRAATALATLPLICAALPMSTAFAQTTDQTATDQASLEEIVVTGSYIRRKSQFDSPSPIQVLGSEQLEQIGASTIAELTQTLTINNGSQNNSDAFTQNQTTGTENINLRGLGVQSTLVLLNGRRQVGSSAPTDGGLNFVDTSSLVPLIAVDRVEILKDGSAALYGTDAVAGVVNFITRDDFEGLELEAEFQTVTEDSSHDLRISGIWGAGNDRTNFIVAASYFDRTELTSRERDLRRGGDAAPNYLSVSTNTSFPPNFIVPTSLALQNPANPFNGLVPGYTQAFDGFTPFAGPGALNLVPGIGPDGNPTLVFGGFLPASDGISDGLTSLVLSSQGIAAQLAQAGLNPALILGQIQAEIVARQRAGLAAGQLTTFDTPFVPDPQCAAVSQNFDSDTRLLPPSGTPTRIGALGQCALDFGPYFSVVPDEERIQGYTKLKHQLTDSIETYAEFSYSRNRAERSTSNFPTTSPISFPDLSVNPATDPVTGFTPPAFPFFQPFNAFGPGTLFITRSPGIGQLRDGYFTDRPNPNTFKHDTYRVSTGARGDITETWYFDFAFTRSVNDFKLTSHDGVKSKTELALRGFGGEGCDPATGIPGVGPCLFYNPFASGYISDPSAVVPLLAPSNPLNPLGAPPTPFLVNGAPVLVPLLNSQEVLEFISSPITVDNKSELNVVDLVVSGDLFELPAGTAGGAFGFQYRDESLKSDFDEDSNRGDRLFVTAPTGDFSASRDVWAVFAEFAVPITEQLELSTAVRYEKYSGNAGDTIDPKVSLLYKPLDQVTLRGSFGTSFRAPSLFQTFGNQTTLNSVRDVRTGGQPFLAIRTNGSEDLRPEESTTFNIGASVEPVENLEFNVDFWSFDFSNVISEIPAEQLAQLNSAGQALPAGTEVLRTATGALAAITTVFSNDNKIKTNGLDFSVAYTLDADDLGTFRFGIDGTWVNTYDLTGIDGIKVDGVGRSNRATFADPVPELKTNFSVLYANGGHSAAAFARRIGKILDDRNTVFGELPGATPGLPGLPDLTNVITPVTARSHTTVDLQYSYTFDGEWGPLKGAGFTLGVNNLFDRNPPFLNVDSGFESRVYDPRGRLVYIKAKVGF